MDKRHVVIDLARPSESQAAYRASRRSLDRIGEGVYEDQLGLD
jgi:hypothetical protein